MPPDPHTAENNPESTAADLLYAALLRIVKELEDGYYPGIGAHGQAYRALHRYQAEEAAWPRREEDDSTDD